MIVFLPTNFQQFQHSYLLFSIDKTQLTFNDVKYPEYANQKLINNIYFIANMKKKIKVKSLEGTPFLISQEEQIGAGSFGRVLRAYKRDEPSLQLVAKIIPIVSQNKDTIISQIKILKQIPHHPNLVNCLKMQISTQHNFYLIMQYCNGGSFQKYITQNNNCSEEIVWRFIREFVKGYRVLYDCHVVHRDIKPQNILIHDKNFKIADFGLSRSLHHHSLTQNLSVKGTPLYIAPQLQSQAAGNSKIDVFSFGVVIYRLAFNGAHPFYNQQKIFTSASQYFQHLLATPLKFPKFPKRSVELISLISLALQKSPINRISWKQIFEHPKIKQKQISPLSQQELNQVENAQSFQQLHKSIIQINRSSASLEVLSQPFNHQSEVGAQMDRLVQFTQYLPKFQIKGLEIFVTRSKVVIQLIKYLNGKLKFYIEDAKNKMVGLIQRIIMEGYVYIQYTLSKIIEVLNRYQSELPTPKILVQTLLIQQKLVSQILQSLPSHSKYEHLRYENILYDYLTEFCELKHQVKQKLKIPTALMVDLYDGLLKLQSIIAFNQNGKIEVVDIELEDAELDKINYMDLSTYKKYLDQVNQITLNQLEKNLKSMGLMII